MSAARFSLDEAATSLWRRRRATGLSILTITLALFVLGVFLLVHANLRRWMAEWTRAAEFSVYLTDATDASERGVIERILAASPSVVSHEYVSSEEAVRRFARLFPELAQSARSLGDRPLPSSFDVRLAPGAAEDGSVERLAASLRKTPGVIDVRYDRQWLERLSRLARTARLAGFGLAATLALAAALTVAAVVRLALHARQEEIEIMHLVGAPLAYIRGPFVMEGVLQGGAGALVALVALYAGYLLVRTRIPVLGADTGLLQAGSVGFLPPLWMLGLLAGGMIVGCVGGAIAARSAA